MESSNYVVLKKIGGRKVVFLDFHLGFCGLRLQTTNSSILELFLDDFHDDS